MGVNKGRGVRKVGTTLLPANELFVGFFGRFSAQDPPFACKLPFSQGRILVPCRAGAPSTLFQKSGKRVNEYQLSIINYDFFLLP